MTSLLSLTWNNLLPAQSLHLCIFNVFINIIYSLIDTIWKPFIILKAEICILCHNCDSAYSPVKLHRVHESPDECQLLLWRPQLPTVLSGHQKMHSESSHTKAMVLKFSQGKGHWLCTLWPHNVISRVTQSIQKPSIFNRIDSMAATLAPLHKSIYLL